MAKIENDPDASLRPRFADLVTWERKLLGPRWGDRWQVFALIFFAVAIALIWWTAGELEPFNQEVRSSQGNAAIALVMAPLYPDLANLDRLSFGYTLLCLTAYLVAAIAHLVIPGMAGGTVAKDRRTGRLEEIRLTLYRPATIYFAKVVAVSRPFVMIGLAGFILFGGVAAADYVPLMSVFPLFVQMILAVLMPAVISVTASTLFRVDAAARIAAYIGVWAVMPAVWACVLHYISITYSDDGLPGHYLNPMRSKHLLGVILDYSAVIVSQAGICIAAIAVAGAIGWLRLRRLLRE